MIIDFILEQVTFLKQMQSFGVKTHFGTYVAILYSKLFVQCSLIYDSFLREQLNSFIFQKDVVVNKNVFAM